MLIIIEGPDCAGKTYLANGLRDALKADGRHNVQVAHNGPPTKHPLEEYGTPLYDYRPGRDTDHILDRWHIGEDVYPEALNRHSSMTFPMRVYIDMLLQSRGALMVLLLPPIADILRCVQTRGETFVTEYQLRQVHALFSVHAANQPTLNSLLYRFHPKPSDVRYIIDVAESLDVGARALNEFVTYVGPVRPDVLILGDVRGAGPLPSVLAPAFVPYGNTSGHFLLAHLFTHSDDFGMANACDVDDVRSMWNALGQPSIVTLGRNADKAVTTCGITHGAAPHPQYVRRFHHKHGGKYRHVIREAAREQRDMLTWRP